MLQDLHELQVALEDAARKAGCTEGQEAGTRCEIYGTIARMIGDIIQNAREADEKHAQENAPHVSLDEAVAKIRERARLKIFCRCEHKSWDPLDGHQWFCSRYQDRCR